MTFSWVPLAAERGFAAGDVYVLGLLAGGLALFALVGALSQQEERAFTAAVVYLLLGALLSLGLGLLGVDLLDPREDAKVIERFAEFAVIVALFSAGLKLERPIDWRSWRVPALLIIVVMPLSIAAVAAFGVVVMGLSLGAAVVLGAALAPTDPVLASDIQVGPPGDEHEPEARFALTAEAGLNDGFAFPFVFLGLFIAAEGGTGWLGEWLLADVLYAAVLGIGLGALGGRYVAALVTRLHDRRWLRPELDGWLAVGTVLVVYGVTELAGAYGFLAAFASGLAFRRYERGHEKHERVHNGAQTVENFTELALVLLLGSTVTVAGLGEPGIAGWLLAPFLLVLVRPLATFLALAPTRVSRGEKLFIGWLGVRGIGTFYYLAVALGSGVLPPDEGAVVYYSAVVCAGISILVHGTTATPLRRRYDL